jgi:hypothetical protein
MVKQYRIKIELLLGTHWELGERFRNLVGTPWELDVNQKQNKKDVSPPPTPKERTKPP